MDENLGRSRRRRPGGCSGGRPDRPSLLAAVALLLATSRPDPALAARRRNMRGRNARRQTTHGAGGGPRSLAGEKAPLCPTGYTGTVPTESCSGYVACTSGAAGTSQACAAGTVYDMASATCTWPDAVSCRWGDELEVELGTGGGSDEDEVEGAPSRFCPPMYNGRAPTTGCEGYVQCNAGKEGLSAYCPPNTSFDRNTQQCSYAAEDCEMMVDQGPGEEESPPENPLDGYCPDDYTGRAPIDGCKGYVSCESGEARRSRLCPDGTLFDIMTLACSYSSSVADRCEALNVEPTPAPATRDEMRAQYDSIMIECPPGHSGNVPLPGCERYIYCQQGVLLQNYTCNAGTLYDPSIQNCNWADAVECETTKAPSFAPTLRPSGTPSGKPTESPVAFDRTGKVYYPDFSRGVCSDDGDFPPDVPNQYLFHRAEDCCGTYFPGNMDDCLEATAPTPSPVREGFQG